MKTTIGQLRVWWIPQVPLKPFHCLVNNIDEAMLLLTTFADYDLFQFRNKIKPDYCNAGGLEVFDGNEWTEWHDEEDRDIDDLIYLQTTALLTREPMEAKE